MSRSLRHHHREGTDVFPTPPSSASTPPTTIIDDPPPRKRARYNPPGTSEQDPITINGDIEGDSERGRLSSDAEVMAVKLPRIRIKMAQEGERRTSSRLVEKHNDEDEEYIEMDDDTTTMTPIQETQEEIPEISWEDQEVREMVDPLENWRVIGLSNVGNTCFTNAILQVFSQTEILGECFIRRYPYIPPSLTAITNPLTSADLSSRSSRSKTRRDQVIQQEPPALITKSLTSSFSRLLRALHPDISPPVHRLGVTYHQPKKHKSDSKYTIAPREFLGTFNSVYPSFRKGESQEDAMEFFSKVRERLHDELRADLEVRIRTAGKEIESDEQWIMGTSPISDIFRGYYVTKRMCTICNTPRDAPLEETWQLPVAVPSSLTPALQPHSLSDLIAHYGGVEKDVNVECRQCGGNTPHDSRPSYLQTPRILVIQALRFVVPKTAPEFTAVLETESTTGNESPATDSSDNTTNIPNPPLKRRRTRGPQKRKVIKNPAHITFPLTRLDMTSYLSQRGSSDEELYDLFAVVEHVGRRMDGGHYIAYIRGKDNLGKDIWWKCNDAKCWMVSPDLVSLAQGYIWFYERRSQRGTVPEDWMDVIPDPVDEGIASLATPESDQRGNGQTAVHDGDTELNEDQEKDVRWEGRLRGSSG